MPRRTALCLTICLLLPIPLPAAEAARLLELSVDLTEAPRKLLHARLVIPATPGPLTLYYPKWIPGEHSPSGPIADLAGLKLRAGGKPLAWRRDDVDLYAFHCTVPEGAEPSRCRSIISAPSSKEGFSSVLSHDGSFGHPQLESSDALSEGPPVRDIHVRASLTLPPGWKQGTALPIDSEKDANVQYKTVSLETLVDSPVLCGTV